MKIEINENYAYVFTPYNAKFVTAIKGIGGAKWDRSRKAWCIPAAAVDQARVIMKHVYGETDIPDGGKKVSVQLTFKEPFYAYNGAATIYGKTVATAFGRDSGAKVGSDAIFISGAPESGGSAKYWRTTIPEGSVVVLRDVPEIMLTAEELPDYIAVEVLHQRPDREQLEAERKKLIARIAEIDAMLQES